MDNPLINNVDHIWSEFLIWTGLITTSLFDYSHFNIVLLQNGINIINFDLFLKISEMIVQWISSIYACVKIVQWASSLFKKDKDGK